jgi:hypothetical protein
MKKEDKSNNCCQEEISNKYSHCHGSNQSNTIYGLGVVGALFYFLSNSTSFWEVILGIGKSIFWPAILTFNLLTYLQI